MSIICNLRSATDAQAKALLADPEQLEAFLEDEEDFGDAAGSSFVELDLDEAWHGIHFLLTGTAVEGQAPLDFLERGGREVGDTDLGYGPARAFDAAGVRAIAQALAPIEAAALRARFDPERMRMLEIYPDIWDGQQGEKDPLGYVLSYYAELKAFLARIAALSQGMVLVLS
jgi:hypothetical protein